MISYSATYTKLAERSGIYIITYLNCDHYSKLLLLFFFTELPLKHIYSVRGKKKKNNRKDKVKKTWNKNK